MCSQSKVLNRSTDGRSFRATLTVGFPPFFEETYCSLVNVIPETLTVETKSTESKLFDSLQSRWKLDEVIPRYDDDDETKACHVDFEVTMAVSDPIIVATLDQVLKEVASRQVAAFDERCRQIPMMPELVNDMKTKKQ